MSIYLDTALAGDAVGLSMYPPKENGSKMPDTSSWTGYHTPNKETGEIQRETPATLRRLYANGRTGVGAFMGAVSGNVELFEFDDRATYDAYLEVAATSGLGDLIGRVRTGYEEETPGGGIHWLIRCDEVSGNTELAKRPAPTEQNPHRKKILIETRGTGGYAVLAPSNGRVHPTNGAYTLRSGGLGQIATITPDERRAMWELARTFDEEPEEEITVEARSSGTGTSDGDLPGRIFNQRATWAEVLEPHGWKKVHERKGITYWRRPDKNRDHSATTNAKGTDTFHCFSSSTPFKLSPSSYSKFGAYTVLNYKGDFSAAGKALYAAGYRKPEPGVRVGGSENEPDGGEQTAGATGDRTSASTTTRADFLAIPSQNSYVYRPTREFWSGEAVNRLLPAGTYTDKEGKERKEQSTAAWLTQHQRAEQMTWMPGESEIITDRYLVNGAWQPRPGARAYNLYQTPHWVRRDEQRVIRARPWYRLVRRLYPDEWGHIVAWMAWRVQRPGVKINHALVLGGDQGIGKDTILDPLRVAVGAANCTEVSPQAVMGTFTDFRRSVILRISEIRDLGDVNRYSFYEHTKTLIASPPEMLPCNQKYLQPFEVPNLTGVIFTTNHRQGGLYLPADDRRHFVCWSEVQREDFSATYFPRLYRWLDAGGREEVAADLAAIDLDRLGFDPKAPPPQTEAFHQMVDAGQSPETTELADLIETMGAPPALTLTQISALARTLQRYSLVNWIEDRKNLRAIPHRMAEAGYVPVRNPYEARGRWAVSGQKVTVYAQRALQPSARMAAAEALR